MINLGDACTVGAMHVRDFIQFGDAFRLELTRGQHGDKKRLRMQALPGNSAEIEMMPANDIDTSKGGILSQILFWTDENSRGERARFGLSLRRQQGGTREGEADVMELDMSTYYDRPCPPIEITMGQSTGYVDGKEITYKPTFYALFIYPDGKVVGVKRDTQERVTLSEGSTLLPGQP